MSKQKTERLLSLVVCLLSSRRYLTAGRSGKPCPAIRSVRRVQAHVRAGQGRAAGARHPAGDRHQRPDEEVGYRISRQAYELPEIVLEPDEAAVLGLAAQVWQRAELAGAAAGGLLKLRAAGIDAEETTGRESSRGCRPRTAFGPLWRAVRDRRPVPSATRRPAGRVPARNLEPWGVVNRNGNWYVAGFDRDRGEQRVFRLSRIDGPVSFTGPPGSVTVPPGTDVRAAVQVGRRAAAVRGGAADPLRRRLRAAPPGDLTSPARRLGPGQGGVLRRRLVRRLHRLVRRRRRRHRAGRPARGRIRRLKGVLA